MKLHKVLNTGAAVGCERLRQVAFYYFGFDDQLHGDGRLVVLDAVAGQVLQILNTLEAMRFPIAKASPIEAYEGNDEASMADNNTSSFNDRAIKGSSVTSLHAYGLAIDLNPVQNPFVKRESAALKITPKGTEAYSDRKSLRPGMAKSVVDVFADHGFVIWGGDWHNPTDYQHFQVSRDLAKELTAASPAHALGLFELYVARYQKCRNTSVETQKPTRRACSANARP